MSKAPSELDKLLILRAYKQIDAYIRPNEIDREPSAAASKASLRAPTGECGLPCDRLFSLAAEPVLILEATTERIVQANPAAAELLGLAQHRLVGAPVLECFEGISKPAMSASTEMARAAGRADATVVQAVGGTELSAKVSLFRAGADGYLLVRLSPKIGQAQLEAVPSPTFEAIEGASVGFLVTDAGLRVEYANQAFAEMADISPMIQIQGKSLARWLELSEDDMALLHNQMLQRQATTVMTTRLRSEQNRLLEVEVCAVAVPDGQSTCWGFTVREVPRLN